MSTLIENLQEQIAYLKEKGTPSALQLAKECQKDLDVYLKNPEGTAQETYFSGNPVVARNPQVSQAKRKIRRGKRFLFRGKIQRRECIAQNIASKLQRSNRTINSP